MGDLGSFGSAGVERKCRGIARHTVTDTYGGKMEILEGFQISDDELECSCGLVT